MHPLDGVQVVVPSDPTGFLACDHLTPQELAALRGELTRPERSDPDHDILHERGLEHERRHKERLIAEGRSLREIGDAGPGLAGLHARHDATLAAMRDGAEVIYQATFFDGRWLGHVDFLERVEKPSALGPYGYEVTDTKLARRREGRRGPPNLRLLRDARERPACRARAHAPRPRQRPA